MATKKPASTTQKTSSKSKSDAVKLKEARAEIKELKALMANIRLENEQNLSKLSAVEKEMVPKEVLKSESLNERMNWWFKDLSGKDKVISQIIMMVIIGIITFGAYSGSSTMFSDMEGQEIISLIITLATGALGANFQLSSMKTPNKNN